jgi:beta-glucosidase/6-phospho-beta-glucosidase/beta-galactosidase
MSLLLEWIWQRYGDACKNILITENGWSMPEGDLNDNDRILYMKNYLMNILTMRERLNVTHYFIWSLIDNFEWSSGYKEKYGLLSVNRNTWERTWKKSAFWIRNLLAP